ncbi:MAG TPA: hypothetical protein VGK73_18095, partial [Polyangiaceae bacterium]
MSPRALFLLFRIYTAALLLLCVLLSAYLSVDRDPDKPLRSIVSVWSGGVRRERAVVDGNTDGTLRSEGGKRGATRVIEEVLDEGPVLGFSPVILFGAGFVPGNDGVL